MLVAFLWQTKANVPSRFTTDVCAELYCNFPGLNITHTHTHTHTHIPRYIYIYKMIKVKVKITLEQATKAQRGSRGIALLFR